MANTTNKTPATTTPATVPTEAPAVKNMTFSQVMATSQVQEAMRNALVDPKRIEKFTTSIISAVTQNPTLKECNPWTLINGALVGEGLNLSPSPQLGQYYLVPFNSKTYGGKVAQFQLGYRGYIQLAIRSGYYKKLNVLEIKEGELIGYDPLNEEIEVNLIDDPDAREKAKTVGYYAMFEYKNGFRKTLYWSRAKMETHAKTYSKAYNSPSSFWQKDFDAMGKKTMIRQLISKWGIMSVELENAYNNDMAAINEDGSKSYVESEDFIEDLDNAPAMSLDDFE